MALNPICPSCKADARKDAAFTMLSWGPEEAERNGFDPKRTSAVAFGCHACSHEFPAFFFRKKDPDNLIRNLVHDDGTPYPEDEPGVRWWEPGPTRRGPIQIINADKAS